MRRGAVRNAPFFTNLIICGFLVGPENWYQADRFRVR